MDFQATLEYLFHFIAEVSEHSEVNKMAPSNLAIVFGPTLMRFVGSDNHTDCYSYPLLDPELKLTVPLIPLALILRQSTP